MKSILKDTNNSEKLLNMVSDTLILMDKDGVCVDIAIHNVDLWFIKEKRLLGKNLLSLLLHFLLLFFGLYLLFLK